MKKRIISLCCVVALLLSMLGMVGAASTKTEEISIKMQTPAHWEMTVGDSRSVEVTFLPETLQQRGLVWESSAPEIASVDIWGRVTAKKAGTATIRASSKADDSKVTSALLTAVEEASGGAKIKEMHDFSKNAYSEQDVATLQKYVDRYSLAEASAEAAVPQAIKACIGEGNVFAAPAKPQKKTTTADGAIWTIEKYGVKRYDRTEALERNREQRFMAARYLPDDDTPITAIAADGAKGIWTISAAGVTHIRMEELSLQDKAIQMSDTTQELVARRGMVAQAGRSADGSWIPQETDNDGLWTSMYGGGEIFRYGALKEALAKDPNNTLLQQQVADAKAVATQSAEAVLLLGNISARTGTTEAYVRYLPPMENPLEAQQTSYSSKALLAGKDLNLNIPGYAPTYTRNSMDPAFLVPFDLADETVWADPREQTEADGYEYAKRTRLLEGFICRTYVLDGLASEDNVGDDGYYYHVEGDSATCITSKPPINGEERNGGTVDASGEIPARLLALIDTVDHPTENRKFNKNDIIYKGDTSSDEIIGHLFIYKVAYDILGPDDPELKQIIVDTVCNYAQHLLDNGYNMVDSTGQPTTWAKFDRAWLYSYQTFTDASMNCLITLNTFKLAAYMTGEKKWEDEYQMLATGKEFQYAELVSEYWARWENVVDLVLGNEGIPSFLISSSVKEYLIRNFLNYSNEEMIMLAYYLIFQMEDDAALVEKYRTGLDSWWISMKYSENPLWYYIYQLAYPEETKQDAYGNDLVETAAWSLSRHPIDTRKWKASNALRDDIGEYDLGAMIGVESRCGLGYNKKTSRVPSTDNGILAAICMVLGITKLDYAVAAPDERALHKYNASSYKLESDNDPNRMEGSTTYTLPYWMGRYHGMLQVEAAEPQPEPPTESPSTTACPPIVCPPIVLPTICPPKTTTTTTPTMTTTAEVNVDASTTAAPGAENGSTGEDVTTSDAAVPEPGHTLVPQDNVESLAPSGVEASEEDATQAAGVTVPGTGSRGIYAVFAVLLLSVLIAGCTLLGHRRKEME